MPPKLNSATLSSASRRLAELDPALKPIRDNLGPPPLWGRPPNFETLIRIVLEQSVSLASAKAIFGRVRAACGGSVTAKRLLALGPNELRSLGLSQQKARYALGLAEDVRRRRFPIGRLAELTDDEVREQIVGRVGLGPWTADIFLVMALRRPDVFPVGDLALVKGMEEIDGGDYHSAELVQRRAEPWRPYRAVAARMVWQAYLHRRGRTL